MDNIDDGAPITPEQNSREYLLMVNELSMLLISKMFPTLKFIEVVGMSIKDDPNHLLMVTPTPQPIKSTSENDPNYALEAPQQGC